MKKLSILLVLTSIMMVFSNCNTPTADKLCNDADMRAKIISELINNHDYMNQVMDSMMQNKHGMQMMAGNHDMMNNMMSMCSSDTTMCKMMMDKTMEMCDMDKSKCKMMMGSMQEHPMGMESMKDMGMCGMKGMDMNQKKSNHSQHH